MERARAGSGGEDMKILCIGCGFSINLGDAYDEFEGPIKCFTCGSLLEIRTVDGNLKSIKVSSPGPRVTVSGPQGEKPGR